LGFEWNTSHVIGWHLGEHGLNASNSDTGEFSGYRYTNPRGYATAVGVPEPSTLMLLACGVALGLRRRRH
jgi:hypothetical protein